MPEQQGPVWIDEAGPLPQKAFDRVIAKLSVPPMPPECQDAIRQIEAAYASGDIGIGRKVRESHA